MATKCSFAHRLCELRSPPIKQTRILWRGEFDRWLGQQLSDDQVSAINDKFDDTPKSERPTWAIGLAWFLNNDPPDAHPELPWDFNLLGDSAVYRVHLQLYEGLWSRLEQRRAALAALN